MPNGDPRNGFFYPTLTLMIDSYMLNSCTDVLSICSRFVDLWSPQSGRPLVDTIWMGSLWEQLFTALFRSFWNVAGVLFMGWRCICGLNIIYHFVSTFGLWWDGRGLMLWLLSGQLGLTCLVSFAPVFSFMYCWVLISTLSPFYILIYMLYEMMHG